MACRRKRERAGSAAHVEHSASGLETRDADHALTELPIPPMRQQPRQDIVASSPIDHYSMSSWRGLFLHCALQDQRRPKSVPVHRRAFRAVRLRRFLEPANGGISLRRRRRSVTANDIDARFSPLWRSTRRSFGSWTVASGVHICHVPRPHVSGDAVSAGSARRGLRRDPPRWDAPARSSAATRSGRPRALRSAPAGARPGSVGRGVSD